VEVMVRTGSGYVVPPNFTGLTGYEYSFFVDPTRVLLYNSGSNSANIVAQPVSVLITYEE